MSCAFVQSEGEWQSSFFIFLLRSFSSPRQCGFRTSRGFHKRHNISRRAWLLESWFHHSWWSQEALYKVSALYFHTHACTKEKKRHKFVLQSVSLQFISFGPCIKHPLCRKLEGVTEKSKQRKHFYVSEICNYLTRNFFKSTEHSSAPTEYTEVRESKPTRTLVRVLCEMLHSNIDSDWGPSINKRDTKNHVSPIVRECSTSGWVEKISVVF